MTDGELRYLSGDFDAEMETVEDYWDYLDHWDNLKKRGVVNDNSHMTYDEFKDSRQ